MLRSVNCCTYICNTYLFWQYITCIYHSLNLLYCKLCVLCMKSPGYIYLAILISLWTSCRFALDIVCTVYTYIVTVFLFFIMIPMYCLCKPLADLLKLTNCKYHIVCSVKMLYVNFHVYIVTPNCRGAGTSSRFQSFAFAPHWACPLKQIKNRHKKA